MNKIAEDILNILSASDKSLTLNSLKKQLKIKSEQEFRDNLLFLISRDYVLLTNDRKVRVES